MNTDNGKKFDVAVIVTSYCPNWKKMKATLSSIIEQKDIKLQIIIADDGSPNNHFEQVRLFFEQYGFTDFYLVENKENRGTVVNILSGLYATNTEYVKLISPGDLLYDEFTMNRWFNFAKENGGAVTFSNAVFYHKDENDNFIIHRCKNNPHNIRVFNKPTSYLDRVINYILLEDGISGAKLFLKRDILIYYLKLMQGKVIYGEDFFLRIAVIEKIDIIYYPAVGVWYEYGNGGISTSGNKIWQELLENDSYNIGKICLDRYDGDDSRIQECLSEYCHRHKTKKHSRIKWAIKLLLHPRWFYWYIMQHLFMTYTYIPEDDKFLRYCFR